MRLAEPGELPAVRSNDINLVSAIALRLAPARDERERRGFERAWFLLDRHEDAVLDDVLRGRAADLFGSCDLGDPRDTGVGRRVKMP